jgi:hypothetical protein
MRDPKQMLRDAHDPVVAAALWFIVGAAVVGAVFSAFSWPMDFGLADILPPLGGAIVLLGSYFAARTLRDNEIVQSTQMLQSEREAVRVAGVGRLWAVGKGVPRFREQIRDTLQAFASDPSAGKLATEHARRALADLPKEP